MAANFMTCIVFALTLYHAQQASVNGQQQYPHDWMREIREMFGSLNQKLDTLNHKSDQLELKFDRLVEQRQRQILNNVQQMRPTSLTDVVPIYPLQHACMIEAVSWGMSDIKHNSGYIAVNGHGVIRTTSWQYRGFNTAELNVSSCSASNVRHFDTWFNTTESENMATYISSLPVSTVLIGITSDEAVRHLTASARTALDIIGVDVSGLVAHGKVSFMAQIGQPTMSVFQVAPRNGTNLKLNVIARGWCW